MDLLDQPYERDGVVVLPVEGEFDVGNAGDLERRLADVGSGGRSVILDLTNARYIDSSVLAVLIRRKKALGASAGLVVPKSSRVRLIFDVAGLADVLNIAESVDAAVTNVSEKRLGAP